MLPLRRLLTRHLLLIQMPVMVVLLGLVWWGCRSLLLIVARRDGQTRLRIAVEALDRRLTAVEQAGAFVTTYWQQGRLPFEDTGAGTALLMPWLSRQDDTIVVNLLDEQGRSLLLMRSLDGSWHTREIRRGARGNLEARWQKAGPGGPSGTPQPFLDAQGYDARARPWYRDARVLAAPRWSEPYRLDPPQSRLVLTWLVPLKDGQGRLQGALGLDLPAQELQAFLELLRPTAGSRIWALDQHHQILASARGGQGEVAVSFQGRALGERLDLGGVTHALLHRDLPGHPGSQWHMVMAIPEADLLAPAQGKLWGITVLASLLLLLPTLWGLWAGKRLAAEAQDLATAAVNLGAGRPPDLGATRILEFQTLGQALTRAHLEIQERARFQQQLQHSQRLETMGTLAGGIAHDVNNQLNAILANLYLARESVADGHPAAERLAQAEEAVDRCTRTTKALLAFSHQGLPEIQPVDCNALVRQSAVLLDRVLGGLVKVELDLEPGLPTIMGEPLQLEQVLMNLAINARDAMAQGGTLTLRTRAARDGAGVELQVLDTGTGIPEDVLGHIFEPFFTTKPIGQGTGLGLAMAFGIVQAHGGQLTVATRVGQGTTFTLTLAPGAADPGGAVAAPPVRESRALPQGLRILVVEDEAYLLEILSEALATAGATVTGAAHGEEAWERFQAGAFDCVLSDQRMPGCTGVELLHRIRASGSLVPFILASGQDLEPYREALDQDPSAHLLPKPFSVTRLVDVVRSLGLTGPA
jgi:signal transduction histidine kinase/CheY-like chemotaxis protein